MGYLDQKAKDVGDGLSHTVSSVLDTGSHAAEAIGTTVSDAVHDVGSTIAKDPILSTAAGAALIAVGVPAPIAIGLVQANRGASVEQILTSAALAGVIPAVAGEASSAIGGGTAGAVGGAAAGAATGAALTGKDIGTALQNSLVSSGFNLGTQDITADIPGYDNLTDAQKQAVNTTISNTIQGKDPTQALLKQAINAGIAEAKNQGGQDTVQQLQDSGLVDTSQGSAWDAATSDPNYGGQTTDVYANPVELSDGSTVYKQEDGSYIDRTGVPVTEDGTPLITTSGQDGMGAGGGGGGGGSGGPTKPVTPTVTPKPVTPTPKPTTPTPAATSGVDVNTLLAFLSSMGGQQQVPTVQDPYAHIKSYKDIYGHDFADDGVFAKTEQNTANAATGGSVDDLLKLLGI